MNGSSEVLETVLRTPWVVRPTPNYKHRLENFISDGMVAVGWPEMGDLTGVSRAALERQLFNVYKHYQEDNRASLCIACGILDRFVNQIQPGDYVLVPHERDVYIGEVTSGYVFMPELAGTGHDQGFPHWHKVRYLNQGNPMFPIKKLPLSVRRALDCTLAVFSITKGAALLWKLLGIKPPTKKSG